MSMIATVRYPANYQTIPASRRGNSHPQDVDHAKSATLLFKTIEENDWGSAASVCKEYPQQAKTWVVRWDKYGSVSWRRLPLHEACIRKAPWELIKVLLEVSPSSVRNGDHAGRLPLHHACIHGAPLEVVENLIMAYPGALDSTDAWEKTPGRAATATSYEHRKQVIAAVEKGSLYYIIKKHELVWRDEAEKKMRKLEFQFAAEKKTYETKIKAAKEQLEADREDHLEKLVDAQKTFEEEIVEYKKRLQDMEKQLQEERDEHQSQLKAIEGQFATEREENEYRLNTVEKKACQERKIVRNLASELRKELNATKSKCEALENDIKLKSVSVESLEKRMVQMKEQMAREQAEILALATLASEHAKDKETTLVDDEKLQKNNEIPIHTVKTQVRSLVADKVSLEQQLADVTHQYDDLRHALNSSSEEQSMLNAFAAKQQKLMESALIAHTRMLEAAFQMEQSVSSASKEHESFSKALEQQRQGTRAALLRLTGS